MTQELMVLVAGGAALTAAVIGGMATIRRIKPRDSLSSVERADLGSTSPQLGRPRPSGVSAGLVRNRQGRPGGEPAWATRPEHDKKQATSVEVIERQRIIEEPPEVTGVTRRRFFNRALGVGFFGFLAVLGLDVLAFFWPRISGGFGSDINAGNISELQNQMLNADGSVTPVFVPEARAYVVPAPRPLPETYQGTGVATEDLFALYQRCVHLGCRVPWCATSQGFECPCHGSKYSMIGEYYAGPAPRSLDRFVVEVTSRDELVIKTSQIIQTPRLGMLNVPYPQGPSCIGG